MVNAALRLKSLPTTGLEYTHMINLYDVSCLEYDVRRGGCATNLNAKEKRSSAKNSRDIKSSLDSRQFRFTNKIITAEQKEQITETTHTYIQIISTKQIYLFVTQRVAIKISFLNKLQLTRFYRCSKSIGQSFVQKHFCYFASE